MPPREIEIVAPSRLHFGLLSFGQSERRFGGVGAMIATPCVRIRMTPAEQLTAAGPHADRCLEFARRWSQFHRWSTELGCRIEVIESPRAHMGLGTGTQLGISIAAGLSALFDVPMASPAELAISVGRGRRSAVGTHGFGEGGLIVDGGKSPRDAISALHCRLDIPHDWRFVMICPHEAVGLFGNDEQETLQSLHMPAKTTDELQAIVRDAMIPALAQHDFGAFSESVYRYGRMAGQCFAERQGGPYNGPLLTEIVETIRSLGVTGVGQSSWGPTIFSLLPDQAAAELLVDRLSRIYDHQTHDIWISAPNNTGAKLTVGIDGNMNDGKIPI